ncbi:hypothetical protein [Phytohabitans rumicis]|uniref:PBP domain-containing protein n=1 Tax=Phytohabitans rumicis TaxID=1076125 RepID=A0A6V8KXF2_9ACTN|nr:hypothetical protein [Phytohabitans rumicis]GFJ86516.1 hypothetical protein Prum_001580 [Phytohabitans rumicis]
MKVKTIGNAVVVGFTAVLAVAMAATPAVADPPSPTDYRILTGVGSDTTQDAVNGLGAAVEGAGVIASWDARGTSTIKTKATGCTFTRPNGSGAGRQALRASEGENLGGTHGGAGFYLGANVVGCADFARSSSYGGGTTPSSTGTLTYIPFGVDAMTLAKNVNGDLPNNVSFAQVQRVYKCFTNNIAGNPVTPRMIQADSGTWQFWLQRMQMTEAEIALGDYACLATGSPVTPVHPRVQEHDGTILNGNLTQVVPFSAAQFIAQSRAATIAGATGVTVTDRRGDAYLTGLSSAEQPFNRTTLVVNTNYTLRRDVYNVVPTADLSNAEIDDTFTGADSDVCTATVTDGGTTYNVIELFGFGRRTTQVSPLDAACGYTDLRFNT